MEVNSNSIIVALIVFDSFNIFSKSASPIQFGALSSLNVVFGPFTFDNLPVLNTIPFVKGNEVPVASKYP